MSTSKNILKTYFETGDFPSEAQFGELIDSFRHIDDGKVIKNFTINGSGDLLINLSSNEVIQIKQFVLPSSMPVNFITGLQSIIDNSVTVGQLNEAKDSFRILAEKNSNHLGMYFVPSTINSFKEVTQSVGSIFSSENIHLMTFNFTFQPRASFSGGELPKKIIYEYILIPTNGKFNSNEGAFETTLFKVIVEDSVNIKDPLENFESKQINFLSRKINSGGNIFTKLNFKEKTYDYYGNVIAIKNKTHFVQTLDFTGLGYKGNKLLETLEFDLKIKATLEFEDGTNVNGNNAICQTNTSFKGFLNEKI